MKFLNVAAVSGAWLQCLFVFSRFARLALAQWSLFSQVVTENPAARTRNRHQEAPLQAPAYRPLSPLITVDANAKVIGSATCKCVCISVCVFMFVCV